METNKLKAFGFVVAALTTPSGCTYFNAVRVPTTGSDVPISGAPYNLSFTQYEITVKRRLAGCTVEVNGKKEDKLVIAIEATPKASEKPDPARDYVIDIDSLQSIWKTSAVEVKWNDSGRIDSISASAKDKTGAAVVTIATAVAKTVIGVSTFGGGGNVDILVDGKTVAEPKGACTEDTFKMFRYAQMLEPKIKSGTEKLARATKKLEALQSVAGIMGKDLSAADKSSFSQLQLSIAQQAADLEDKQKELQGYLKEITYTDSIVWPPNGSVFGENVVKGSPVKAARILAPLTAQQVLKWGSPGDDKKILPLTSVWIKIAPSTPIGTTDPCTTTCAEDASKGLKYRPKAPGYLVVCKAADCSLGSENEVGKDVGMISQLGRVYVIPLKSGLFSDKTLVATFDKVGQPTMIGVKSEASVAEQAALTGSAVLEQAMAARAAAVPSRLERLKAEVEQRKLEKDLADVEKALAPAPNAETTAAAAAFSADTLLIDAKIANLKAYATLEALQNN